MFLILTRGKPAVQNATLCRWKHSKNCITSMCSRFLAQLPWFSTAAAFFRRHRSHGRSMHTFSGRCLAFDKWFFWIHIPHQAYPDSLGGGERKKKKTTHTFYSFSRTEAITFLWDGVFESCSKTEGLDLRRAIFCLGSNRTHPSWRQSEFCQCGCWKTF